MSYKNYKNSNYTDDEISDTAWIFGIIDKSPERNIFVRMVENIQANPLKVVIENIINVFSLFCTDVYSLYPSVANSLDFNYKIVNHSENLRRRRAPIPITLKVYGPYLNPR
ncbi:hypothetical protein DMUE_1045 [Dictyocoela muelleri]|nr:hypothetical protein DMUE_1045 [Dictyocoela muelleri]